MQCTHKDCFTCPYPDCICNATVTTKRQKLTPEERHRRALEYQRKYYATHKKYHADYYKAHAEKIKAAQQAKRDEDGVKTIWITNGWDNMRIHRIEFPYYSEKGWRRGRT